MTDATDNLSDERPSAGQIPKELAEAIIRVMAGVTRLERTEENKFARYKYTSIDGFLELTGQLCAAAGLFVLSTETDVEITQAPRADKDGIANFLTIRWAFTLVHASGASYGPLYRTVTVAAAGPQAYGSSQSYALKQFMRGLFQIPTGDNDDPDNGQKHQLPEGRRPAPSSSATTSQMQTNQKTARTPEEICASAKLAIQTATVNRIASIRGGINSYAEQGQITSEQASGLLALLSAREGDLA